MDAVTLFGACALFVGTSQDVACSAANHARNETLSVDPDSGTDPVQAVTKPLSATPQLDEWQPFIVEASQRFAIPQTWIRAVIEAESGGRTVLNGKPITSSAGAMGLMQVMPDTYEELRIRYGLGHNAHAPRDNILAGTAYLREMFDRYGTPGFLAAYNAGPGRFNDYIWQTRPLPTETIRYVQRLSTHGIGDIGALQTAQIAPATSLFFVLQTDPKAQSTDEFPRGHDAHTMPFHGELFVTLSR